MKKGFISSAFFGGLLLSSMAQAHIIFDGIQQEMAVSIDMNNGARVSRIEAPPSTRLLGKVAYNPSVIRALGTNLEYPEDRENGNGPQDTVRVLYRNIGSSNKNSHTLFIAESLPSTKESMEETLTEMIKSSEVFHISIDQAHARCVSKNLDKTGADSDRFVEHCYVSADSVWIRQALNDSSKISLGVLMNPLPKSLQKIEDSKMPPSAKKIIKERALKQVPKQIQKILTNLVLRVTVGMSSDEVLDVTTDEAVRVLLPDAR